MNRNSSAVAVKSTAEEDDGQQPTLKNPTTTPMMTPTPLPWREGGRNNNDDDDDDGNRIRESRLVGGAAGLGGQGDDVNDHG